MWNPNRLTNAGSSATPLASTNSGVLWKKCQEKRVLRTINSAITAPERPWFKPWAKVMCHRHKSHSSLAIKAWKASKTTVTSTQNNRCIFQIYWLTFQVNVQASLHSLRLQRQLQLQRRLQVHSDQMEPAVTTVTLANSLWLFFTTIATNLAIWLVNLPLSIRVQTGLHTSMYHVMTCSARARPRALKKKKTFSLTLKLWWKQIKCGLA